MKLLLSLLGMMLSVSSFAQLFFDFEQGVPDGWIQYPSGRWAASDNHPLSGHFSLKHIYDNTSAGRDRISFSPGTVCFSAGTLSWQFILRHAYPPSSANNWGIFLVADGGAAGMIPGSNIRGVVAGVNYSGYDDLLKLWYVHDGSSEVILSTEYNWQENTDTSAAILRITRDPAGIWKVYIDTSLTGSHFLLLGQTAFPDTFPARHFGITYKYSSARDRLLWIDDLRIDGTFVRDTTPPRLCDYRFPHPAQVALLFSEEIITDSASFTADHEMGAPSQVQQITPDSLLLLFPVPFREDTQYHILIHGVKDLAGNRIRDTFPALSYHRPRYLEVQINEIMADPSPPLGLPEAEYIELYNATSHRLWLDHCRFLFGEHVKALPLTAFPPHSWLILADRTSAPLLQPYGRVIALPAMPSLVNTGMSLTLEDSTGNILSHITYSSDWYGDPYKAEGGWSLEQIDPAHPCPRRDNWTAARVFPGGTPGSQNSVEDNNPDLVPARITNLFLTDDRTLRLIFSEPYDTATLQEVSHFTVDHQTGYPETVVLYPPAYTMADLHFPRPFHAGIIYNLTLHNIRDCSGNSLTTPDQYRFAQAQPPAPRDIVINEILYNPPPGGVDFVEIYNRSQKVVDLATLFLACHDSNTLALTEPVRLSTVPSLFFPGEYKVITTDPQVVLDEFFTSDENAFIRTGHLPAMPDKQGNIVLTDMYFQELDAFSYDDNMQFPLLRHTEGVTLERIDYDAATQDRMNWHSASSDRGYGTPGLQNSQYRKGTTSEARISTDPEIISPDNDGYHDVLHIHYHFDEPGYVATVMIFNASGVLIRTLANNILLGSEGDILWDGLDAGEKRPETGIYLILIKVFNLKGEVKNYKRTCVVTGRKG